MGHSNPAHEHHSDLPSESVVGASPELTFLFPCLNEEITLATCIRKVRTCLETAGVCHEIIVADNGSTDRSREIATALGCRVVPVSEKGYGAALRAGIDAAAAPYVMFADSDDTYLYEHAGALYSTAKQEAAGMAIASRMIGVIEPGSMPFLHKHLGTPVLTTLINVLFRGRLTDCNSGFRCVRREEYLRWGIRSSGMEFASELLIKALKAEAKMVEIPSGLKCGPPERQAHLRTWRDGMRHLLFILSEKPAVFEKTGIFLTILATLLQACAAILGPTSVAGLHIFDLHSQSLFLIAGVIGAQFYIFACSLFLVSPDRPQSLTRRLIHLDEGVLFFCLLGTLAACGLTVGALVWFWAASGFRGLHQANQLIAAAHFLGLAFIGALGLLSIHTLKKARRTVAQSVPPSA